MLGILRKIEPEHLLQVLRREHARHVRLVNNLPTCVTFRPFVSTVSWPLNDFRCVSGDCVQGITAGPSVIQRPSVTQSALASSERSSRNISSRSLDVNIRDTFVLSTTCQVPIFHHTKCSPSRCRSHLPNKSVNVSPIITSMKNKLTDSWGY